MIPELMESWPLYYDPMIQLTNTGYGGVDNRQDSVRGEFRKEGLLIVAKFGGVSNFVTFSAHF